MNLLPPEEPEDILFGILMSSIVNHSARITKEDWVHFLESLSVDRGILILNLVADLKPIFARSKPTEVKLIFHLIGALLEDCCFGEGSRKGDFAAQDASDAFMAILRDAEREEKQAQHRRRGHEAEYGTPAERQARDKEILEQFSDYQKRNPKHSREAAYRAIARSYRWKRKKDNAEVEDSLKPSTIKKIILKAKELGKI